MRKILLFVLLLSFPAQARLSDFLCSLSLKRLEGTPILQKDDTRAYFKVWLEALDLQVAHPNATPQELAKMLKVPFGRSDLEKMKTVVEEKLATLEAKYPQWNEYLLSHKPESVFHPGDITVADYHTFYRRRAEVFMKKIDSVLQTESITYFDLLSSANLYAAVADPGEWMGNFVSRMRKLNVEQRVLENENVLKRLVIESEKDHFHSFPIMLAVPTFKNLGFRALNSIHGAPIYFAGLVENPLWVDGMHYGIAGFYAHDYSHVPGAFDIYMSRNFRTKMGYVNPKSLRTSKEYQFGAMINGALKLNKLYGDYAKIISNDVKFTKSERKLADALFFYWAHETTRLELLRIKTDLDLKKFFARLEKDVRKKDFEQQMIDRFNNTNDLGQGFKPEERPITRDMISKLIRKILS